MAKSTEFYVLDKNTEAGRLSWPNLFEKETKPDGDPGKYSCVILFDKNSPAIAKLKTLAKQAVTLQFGDKPPAKLKHPFKDGDIKFNEDPEKYWSYEGKFSIRFSSNFAPGVVNERVQPILNQEEIYAGCWVVVSCNAFTWTTKGKNGAVMSQGVSFGFNAIQKIRDDEPFGIGPVNPENIFTPSADASADDPANYRDSGEAGDLFA